MSERAALLRSVRGPLFSILLVAGFGCAGTLVRTPDNRFLEKSAAADLGNTYAKHGLWDRAEAAWAAELGSHPKDPALPFNLGVAAERSGDLAAASSLYSRALELEPRDHYMAALARALGRRPAPEADRWLLDGSPMQRITPLASLTADPNRLGVRLARYGLWERAVVHWQEARSGAPSSSAPLHNLAVDELRRGERQHAEWSVRKAIALEPDRKSLQLLAFITGRAGAHGALARELEGGDQVALGAEFARAGLWEEAVEKWEQSAARDTTGTTNYDLATGYLALGRLDEARRQAEAAIARSPKERYIARLAQIERASAAPATHGPTSPPSEPEITYSPGTRVRVMCSGTCRIRSGPGTSFPVVGGAAAPDSLSLLGASDGWMKVQLASGTTGWISSRLVRIEDANDRNASGVPPEPQEEAIAGPDESPSAVPSEPSVPEGRTLVRVVVPRARVYAEPDDWSKVLKEVRRGATLSAGDTVSSYYEVRLSDGQKGYVPATDVEPAERAEP